MINILFLFLLLVLRKKLKDRRQLHLLTALSLFRSSLHILNVLRLDKQVVSVPALDIASVAQDRRNLAPALRPKVLDCFYEKVIFLFRPRDFADGRVQSPKPPLRALRARDRCPLSAL